MRGAEQNILPSKVHDPANLSMSNNSHSAKVQTQEELHFLVGSGGLTKVAWPLLIHAHPIADIFFLAGLLCDELGTRRRLS